MGRLFKRFVEEMLTHYMFLTKIGTNMIISEVNLSQKCNEEYHKPVLGEQKGDPIK